MIKKLDFYIYAKLHNALQNAKLLKGDYVDVALLEVIIKKSTIEQKYKGISIDKWEIGDIETVRDLTQNITYYLRGLNVAEQILQNVGSPNDS